MISTQQPIEKKSKIVSQKLANYIHSYDEKFWINITRSDLLKALDTLSHYCSYNRLSMEKFNTHASEVEEIVRDFLDYPGNFPDEPKSGIGYLVLKLCKKLSGKSVDPEGKVAAIFFLIKAYTGVDAWKCLKYLNSYSTPPRSFLFNDELHPTDASDYIAPLMKEQQFYSTIPFALEAGLINCEDLINYMINNPTPVANHFHFLKECNIDLCVEQTTALFKSSLKMKKYIISLFLFCKINSRWPDAYHNHSPPTIDDKTRFQDMLNDLIGVIKKPHVSKKIYLLPELIDYIKTHIVNLDTNNPLDKHTNLYTYFYTNLCEKNKLIPGWNKIEIQFIDSNKPDYEKALILGIEEGYKEAVIHLLKSRHISIIENAWSRDETVSTVKISPLFAALDKLEKSYRGVVNLMPHIYENKFRRNEECNHFIKYADMIIGIVFLQPACIRLCDNFNKDIFNYIDEIRTDVENKHAGEHEIIHKINHISSCLKAVKLKNFEDNCLTFFCGTRDGNSSLNLLNHDDLRKEICQVAAKVFL